MKKDLLQSTECAERLKVLGDPLRLRIIDRLRGGPRTVGSLAETLGVGLATASHHLGILRRGEFVSRERHGRSIVYRLRADMFQADPDPRAKDHIDLGCCRLEIPK